MKVKKITSLAILALLAITAAPHALAAIFRDANSTVNTTADPVSWTHTAGSTSTLGVLGFMVNNASDLVSSVSWGASSMTFLDKRINYGGESMYLYYVVNPPTGAQTISVDLTASELVRAVAESYTGTDTSAPIDTTSTATAAGTPITNTFTTNFANDFQYNFVVDTGGGTTHTCNSNCNMLSAFTNISGSDFGPISAAGSTSTAVNTANANNISLLVAFKETQPVAPSVGQRKRVMGIFNH